MRSTPRSHAQNSRYTHVNEQAAALQVHWPIVRTLVAVVTISELSVRVLGAPLMLFVHAAVPVMSSRPAATASTLTRNSSCCHSRLILQVTVPPPPELGVVKLQVPAAAQQEAGGNKRHAAGMRWQS
jgi:hypothetical protein